MARPVEVIALTHVELLELFEGDVYSSRHGDIAGFAYGADDGKAGCVDGLGDSKDGVRGWMATPKLRTILNIVKHQGGGMELVD